MIEGCHHTPPPLSTEINTIVTFVSQQRRTNLAGSRSLIPVLVQSNVWGGLTRSDSGVQPFLWAGPCVSVCSSFLPQRI